FQAEDGIRDDLVTGVQTCAFRSLVSNLARTPLFNRRGRARFETSRMFDQVNVDRGTGEETGAESGDQLEEHESEYNVGMRLAPPNGSRLSCGRNAWGRKEFEPQTRRLASEATQFFPTCERPPASSAC